MLRFGLLSLATYGRNWLQAKSVGQHVRGISVGLENLVMDLLCFATLDSTSSRPSPRRLIGLSLVTSSFAITRFLLVLVPVSLIPTTQADGPCGKRVVRARFLHPLPGVPAASSADHLFHHLSHLMSL